MRVRCKRKGPMEGVMGTMGKATATAKQVWVTWDNGQVSREFTRHLEILL